MTLADHPIEFHPTLLLTDDDRDFRDSLAEGLRLRGYGVWLAGDGTEALAIAREKPIDLLLFDVHMPRMNGLDALESLRSLAIATPCILMSAAIDPTIVLRAQALKTATILAKPFSLQTVTYAIQGVLQSLNERSPDIGFSSSSGR